MTVGEFCNREVVIIGRDETVWAAARLMREHHVGDVVVVEEHAGKRVPIGVVTDRDLVVEVMAPEAPGVELAARDIVTDSPRVIREDEGLFDALDLMRGYGIRRLPVVDNDNALVGILTADDVVGMMSEIADDLATVVGRQREREARRRP